MLLSSWRLPALLGIASSILAAVAIAETVPPFVVYVPPTTSLQDLRRFANTSTVLHVGAHPDDENTELITWLSLGRSCRTAYLSITRGDGGQNELGKDFDEKLGLLRTQELLAARRLDGGRQFFTRAIDFGFSKSPEETLRFWDHDNVLGDVVRVYRTFRPDVVVTRFPIPPGSGGHGHHTASAILAVEAFKLAGDPTAYPEQLKEGLTPWQPKRVLWNAWQGRGGPLNFATFEQDIAGNDPVTGEAFGKIAALSRSQHQTQGLASAANRARTGANAQTFMLLAGEPATTDLLDGVDATWARIPDGAAIGQTIAEIIAAFQPGKPSASLPALLALRARLATLPAEPLVIEKRAALDRIVQGCLGLEISAQVADAEVVPGQKIEVYVGARTQAKERVRWSAVSLTKPGAVVETVGAELEEGGTGFSHKMTVTIDPHEKITQPYWLEREGTAGTYQVDDPTLIGQPEGRPLFEVQCHFSVGDQVFTFTSAPVHSSLNDDREQQKRSLTVVPPVSLALDHDVLLVPPGATRPVTVEITGVRRDITGTVQLEVPAGWTVTPASVPFSTAIEMGQPILNPHVVFQVTATPQAGPGRLTAFAEVNGRRYSHQRIKLDYKHLPVQLLQPPARARLVPAEVAVKARKIGYLPGAGDAIPEALAQLGCEVTVLSDRQLNPAGLAGLDAVVLGVRAFNERKDLAANLPALFAWVETGGTVIAQYNRPNNLKATPLGPYPLSIEGPAPALRVTDETAAVTILAPDHPVLNTPNKITAADFEGWVQERGAYYPSKWDEEHYISIFAMNDPGEKPLKSSLLVAQHGKGWFVYTGLSFFRQLPAGNPGAHRLFANLVSLGK